MSKPMVVTFPFVLLLMDYWPLRRMSIIFQNNEENSSVSKIKHVKINRLILEKFLFFFYPFSAPSSPSKPPDM